MKLNQLQPNRFFTGRRAATMAITVIVVLAFAAPALAQGGGGVGEVVNGMVKSIVEIVQSVAVGAGVLGLTIWGIGKVARPVFPQISGLTQNYIPDLMIGIAVVLVATQIVEALVSSMGGAAGG
jgi:hypothetical protein